ncbi:MAG TPA: hypothetical protein PKN64_00055 [Casimicrobium sp.]|jgi:hypothetical protein|nr:hypothetical protein [Casimicrobium sp.]
MLYAIGQTKLNTSSSSKEIIMNTKNVFASVLFAAAAVSTGTAFASDFTAAQGNPSVQIAQLAPRAEQRSMNVAIGAAKEAAPVIGVSKADARPRAEVRTETRGYFNSAEGREARALYVGGAQ